MKIMHVYFGVTGDDRYEEISPDVLLPSEIASLSLEDWWMFGNDGEFHTNSVLVLTVFRRLKKQNPDQVDIFVHFPGDPNAPEDGEALDNEGRLHYYGAEYEVFDRVLADLL